MDTIVTGGCLCGAVRYQSRGEVGTAGFCHCTDCRRISGSAFGVSVRLAASGFQITSGQPKAFTKFSDSGQLVTRYFCPDCGAPLYTASPRHPDIYFIKAGSLDDPSLVKPDREAWTRSRVPWSAIPSGLATFETNRT